jgi:predicted RNA-binding Zn ribbon-like protein
MVTGESPVEWRVPESIQPGGRPPAPGPLALVQSFINSHYDLEVTHGADLFATPQALARWLTEHGLLEPAAVPDNALGPGDLVRARAVREGLRALASGARGGDPAFVDDLNAAAVGAGAEVRFEPDGPRFVRHTGGGVNAALGLVLALSAAAMVDGTWARLKVCPGDDCGWAFYDLSRNQTGRWCSMSVCGGRAKARAHYRRIRSA